MNEQTTTGANRWVGAAFALFGVILFWGSFSLPAAGNLGDPGAAFFPRSIAVLFVVLGIFLAFRADRPIDTQSPSNEDGANEREKPVRPLLSAAAALLYVPALSLVGFIPATLVYLITAIWILSPRRIGQLPSIIGVAVLFTLAISFALTRWLGVIPPQGTLF